MKTNKATILFTAILSLAALATVSCNRDNVTQPSAVGPSSIAIILNLNACPNVILAGITQRQTTALTATLKKFDGTAQANQTVLFEVLNAAGSRVDVGFFEGSTSVVTRTTDSGGNVTLNYFGPLADEIPADQAVYIKASVAWNGTQFINDTAALSIVRDMKEISLNATATPDLLYAAGTPPVSTIQATVLSGGQPVRNFPVFFLLDLNLGSFSDGKLSTFVNTNDQGMATIAYVGPTADQMPGSSETVTVTVQVTQDLGKKLPIILVRQK